MGLGFATLVTLLGVTLALAPLGLPEESTGLGWLLVALGLLGMVAAIALHVRRHGREHAPAAPPRRGAS
ncbi:hypothetical protein [Nocardioides speluncae]|uniref:hypothetical protein n=1 Tax=Nocardioides speluncae TaxID=2670337 RepID=UPI000D68B6D3|nr:hypothetical protein [Nocardioides speluncae]